ncbi:DUF5979 domain-containing protein [Leucobacter sp. HY1908]
MLFTHHAGVKRVRTAVLAVVTALAVAFTGLVGAVPAAFAATPGLSSTLSFNGNPVEGNAPVLTPGDVLTLSTQYSSELRPGSVAVFEVSDNLVVTGVPKGNSAIKSISQDGNTVTITFNDTINVDQGIFDLQLTVAETTKSEMTKVSWTLDGDTTELDVIIKAKNDEFANVTDAVSKGVDTKNLNGFVVVTNGVVTLKDDVLNKVINYSLNVDSATARSGFVISDQLPTGLSYVAGSFNESLTTWDADGMNRTVTSSPIVPAITGNSFRYTRDLAAPSKLKISYSVKITDATAKQAIEKLLQQAHDDRKGVPGAFSTSLTNTAKFGEVTKTATVTVGGSIAGATPGNGFSKSANWQHQEVRADADGNLLTPAPITYTFKADLRQWDDRNEHFTLTRNVVIEDRLVAGATWLTDDAEFVTVAGAGLTLDGLASCGSAGDFATDAYVGKYCIDGQKLLINVGKHKDTNAQIKVKAQLNSVAALKPVGGQTAVLDAQAYEFRNVASYHWKLGSDPLTSGYSSYPIVLPETDDGLNDSKTFAKTGKLEDATIEVGDRVNARYDFALAAGKKIDLRTSKLVDYVDTTIFDLSDLSLLKLEGTYDGQKLDKSHFDMSQDGEGNVVIELSDAGKALVTSRGVDKRFTAALHLQTYPFEGKESHTLKNRATLFGANDEPLYWSETSAESTSYGDEAEVRKRVYDATAQDWVETVPAQLDAAGNLINDVYTYRVEFIPHGSFNRVTITDVNDVLPAQTEFLGFVSEADAGTGANASNGPVDLEGNIQARYADGVVQLVQKQGTRLEAGKPIVTYFSVKITDATAPIVNKIGTSTATIVPVATFDITKTVTGVQSDNSAVPASVQVAAAWEVDGKPASKQLNVPTDGTPLAFGEQLPRGTEVTLTEQNLTDANGIAWSAPVWSGTGVAVRDNGAAVVTVGETDAAGVSLVNNAGASVASVMIEKQLEGGAADLVTLDGYQVTAKIDTTALGEDAAAQPDRVVTVKPGEATELGNLPVGATVSFSEAKPVDTDLLTWAAPVISPESIVVTEDHFVTAPTITVTNSVERTVGTFDIVKSVTGAEAGNPAVPDAVQVTATWDGGEKVLTVPTDGTPVAFGEQLLIGTAVTLTEAPLANGSGIAWAAPAWSGTGVALTESGDATVTIGRDADARVALENHAATSTAGISLIKQIAGAAAAEVDAATEFTVRASWDLGEGEQHTDLVINAAEPTVLDEQLPAGTVVTLTELERPAVAGVEWGAIAFAGERVTGTADDAAEFVVSSEDGTVDLITVTNEANWAPGTFSLAKKVVGVPLDDADVPESVSVMATWFDGEAEQSKNIELPTDGTRMPFGEMLPYNTTVVLTEAPLAASERFSWATPTWSEEQVTTAAGGVAELTIGAALDTEVTVTNAATATTGNLSITKTLVGEGALEVAKDAKFPVTATWTDLEGKQQERELTLTANEAAVIDGVAFGTDVTIVEGKLPDTGATKWQSAEWTSLGESATVTADGITAVVRVTGEAGSTVALSLANEYSKAPVGQLPNEEGTGDGENSPEQDGGLSVTGAAGFGLLAALGAVLAAAGVWLLLRRRRNA